MKETKAPTHTAEFNPSEECIDLPEMIPARGDSTEITAHVMAEQSDVDLASKQDGQVLFCEI
jgi:hypothetical protein